MQADPHTNINTDHKMIAIKVRQKLEAREEPNREPTLKGIKPEKEGQSTEEALENYYIKSRELVNEAWDNEDYNKDDLYKLTKEAAQHSFDRPKTKRKREDCDPRLRTLLNYRKPAIESNDHHTTKQLTRQTKKLTRKTKLDKLLAGLEDNMWDPVRVQKKGYTPKHTKLKNIQGQQVHDRMRAETFADYHEHEHWAEDMVDRPETTDTPIHLVNEEVKQATSTCKNLKKQ